MSQCVNNNRNIGEHAQQAPVGSELGVDRADGPQTDEERRHPAESNGRLQHAIVVQNEREQNDGMIDVVRRLIVERGHGEFPDQMAALAAIGARLLPVVGLLQARHRLQTIGFLEESTDEIDRGHGQRVERVAPDEAAVVLARERSEQDRLRPDEQIGNDGERGVGT